MKLRLKKVATLAMMAVVLGTTACVATACKSSEKVSMHERKQSNKGRKVKSNIKVKGTNKANGHTTRSY